MVRNYESLNTVGFMKFHTHPIIPLVYTDALSYMEMIGKLVNKVNELIKEVNNIPFDKVLTEANNYTDTKVNVLQVEIEQLIKEIKMCGAKIDGVNKRVDDTIYAVSNLIDMKVASNNEYLIKYLSSLLSELKVINYFTGEKVTVQGMFDYLSAIHVNNGATYDDLKLSGWDYNYLENEEMSYTYLVTHGKNNM